MINLAEKLNVSSDTFNNFLEQIWLFEKASTRIYLPFLLSSLLVMAWWWHKEKKSIRNSLLNTIKDSSFHIDLGLFFLNSLLKVTLFVSIIGLSTEVAWQVQLLLAKNILHLKSIIKVSTITMLGFSIFAFAFDDLLRFIVHMIMHKVPFLWKIHRVHHTATNLNPLTLYRAHPFEVLIATFRNAFSGGTIAALAAFFFGSLDIFYTVLGVNVFGLVFNSALSNLRHSPVPIRFGLLEKVFISPYMHQIHHSDNVNHFNKNYGTCFCLWDRLMGSVYVPQVTESLSFGTGEKKEKGLDVETLELSSF